MPVGVVVNAIGMVEEVLADRSIGVVGSAGQLATYGQLVDADFPNTTTLHYWRGNSNLNDNGPNTAVNFTGFGTPSFNMVGFYGRENVCILNGTSQYFQATHADLGYATASETMSWGGWFFSPLWTRPGATETTLIQFGSVLANSIAIDVTGTSPGFRLVLNNSAALDIPLPGVTGWHHIAVTCNGTTFLVYVDGQLAGTITGTAVTTNTTLTFGADGGGASDWIVAGLQDFFVKKGTVLTSSQVNIIYSKRFKGQQIAGGHVLQADSFPLSSLSGKVSFYNLTNTDDGNANARPLTNNGAIPFTGLNIFGVTGIASLEGSPDHFSSADAFFNTPATHSACGGWYRTNWASGNQGLFSFYNSGTNADFMIVTSATGLVEYVPLGLSHEIPIRFVPGSWHHIVQTYNHSTGTWTVYADGVPISLFTTFKTATLSVASTFRIGAFGAGPSGFYTGNVQDVFFVRDFFLTDSHVRKIYSYRQDLIGTSALITPNNQRWRATLISEDGLNSSPIEGQSFIADCSPAGKVWLDFGGSDTNDPASRVNLRLAGG